MVIGKESGNWVGMDWLVKHVYLTLTKNGIPIFPGSISFVVWELKNYMECCIVSVLWYPDIG